MQDISVSLKLFSEQEIRRLAVVSITNASTTDHGTPKTAGLMDARMGSTDRSILCQTCHKPHCAGHYGMIEFPTRILLPGHVKRVVNLLRCVCTCCAAPLLDGEALEQYMDVTQGFDRIKAVADHCKTKVNECARCKTPNPTYGETNRIFIQRTFDKDQYAKMEKDEAEFYSRRFTIDEAWSIVDKIPLSFLTAMGIDTESHPRNTMMNCILVLPPAQRPTLRIADGGKGRGEDDMTVLYQDVVRAKNDLETKIDKGLHDTAAWNAFAKLQLFVACLVKNSLRKVVEVQGVSDHGTRGIVRTMRDLEHRLKGKTGRLRGTLNAKRTDFSARTVVGIDMAKDIWRLGVPESRMKILTIPVKVTALNLEEMQQRVVSGAYGHRGAVNIIQPVEGEDRMIFLGLMNQETRISLAASLRIGWIVERHMQDGDWVWFNRQPTLHKMNIQAFQVYGVKGLTFRLPLPCTRPFNADFDGDEMNMHVPQSIQAVTEAQELMAVPFNMISPSNTSAIIALVQESLVAWYRLTRRDALVTRDQFMQLMAQIHYSPHDTEYPSIPISATHVFHTVPQPAIIKSPRGPHWTGKQILEVLLPKSIHVTRPVRDGDIKETAHWTGDKEEIVVIRSGRLLLGRLCKATLGGGPSLVHQLWKDVSPWAAAKFVSDAQRVANYWNQMDAMCIGIRDCIIDDETEAEVDDLVATAMGKADEVESTDFPTEIKEIRVTSMMQDVLRAAGALVLKKMNHSSALSTVVVSGSKGNALNISQIMAVVGQQSIGGRRVAHRTTRIGKRGLVCFRPDDRRPEALGFVATSYIQGQTESEFYHAMMAGREGIVATAVETATSGYNQRKMVKIQEGQIVGYDRTVRITSKDIVALHYGGDDYDAVNLERVKLMVRISDAALKDMITSHKGQFNETEFSLGLCARNVLRRLSRPLVPGEYATSLTLPFQPSRLNDQMLEIAKSGGEMTPQRHANWLRTVLKGIQAAHGAHGDAIQLMTTESLADDRAWAKTCAMVILTWHSAFMLDNHIAVSQAQWLCAQILQKVSKALVAPGEAVGTIGSTSIGEPSTQGALNVFHFSGIAEKSGITGVKRFKELLGNAKCRDTCVTNYLMENEEEAEKLAQSLKGVTLQSVLASSSISNKSESLLAKREAIFWPWTSTWMTPLCSKLEHSKQIQAALARGQARGGNDFAIELELDKKTCLRESIKPADVTARLRNILQDTCLVLASETFEAMWHVRIRPLNVDIFQASGFDSRAVCEALLDVLSNCLVKGISIVSDTFHVQSTVDIITEGGGMGKRQWRKVGTVGSDLATQAWIVDEPERLWTTDIQECMQFFGIEAATLLNNQELQRVLSFDSTYVDPRHTQLLADTMSRCGSIAALNRHKMEELGSSLLSRASFEQTLPVFEDAAFFHRSDPLSGSLERQIIGLPLRVGTGIVHLISKNVKEEERTVLAPLEAEPWRANHSVMPLEKPLRPTALSIVPPLSSEYSPHAIALSRIAEDCVGQVYPVAAQWVNSLQKNLTVVFRLQARGFGRGQFDAMMQRVQTYQGWDNKIEDWIQSTDVEWRDDRAVHSILGFEDMNNGKAKRLHVVKNVDLSVRIDWPHPIGFDAKLMRYTQVPAHTVPDSVMPHRVTIRQRRVFEKDGWTLRFEKSWSAPDNLRAEALMLTAEPDLRITLDAASAQASYHGSLNVHEIAVAKMEGLLA